MPAEQLILSDRALNLGKRVLHLNEAIKSRFMIFFYTTKN